jgi:hypothetical protein
VNGRVARALALLALAIAAAANGGCTKRSPAQPNPAFVPEGVPAAEARLVVFPDLPSMIEVYNDTVPAGPDLTDPRGVARPGQGDRLLQTVSNYRTGPGVINLMLFDRTTADAFEMFRRESEGGYHSFQDFILRPDRKWLDGQLEVYNYIDMAPTSFRPSTYLLRGRIGNQFTDTSPLTNVGVVTPALPVDIVMTSTLFPLDSLFDIAWQPVTGAAGYWVQVFQYLEAQLTDRIVSGVPAPIYAEKARDFFLAYVPAPRTSTTLRPNPDSTQVFTQKVTLRGSVYNVRVAAVSASGALIGFTYGERFAALGQGQYALYPIGAMAVGVQGPNGPALVVDRESDADRMPFALRARLSPSSRR